MAISNPLLDEVSMKGAKGVLINITGGPDLMLFEVEQAANRIRAEVDPDANIIFGNTILEEMEGRIRVSVVATGIDVETVMKPTDKIHPIRPHLKPATLRMAEPARPAAPPPALNPVHAQVDALAEEMGAEKSAAETYILGGADAPAIEEPMPAVASYPATETRRPLSEQPFAQKAAAPAKKSGWGFLGRRKPAKETYAEPVAEPRMERAAPRATAQPMPPRPQAGEVPPLASAGDDLFPDHKRDEQFEIPAFLRRQSS
jgi:cell division protein FtsZ